MNIKQIEKLIEEIKSQSVRTYLNRQQLENQRQQIQVAIFQTEQEMVRLDGEEKALLKVKELLSSGPEKKDGK